MDPTVLGAVLGASISGVATVAAALITAWAAQRRGGQPPPDGGAYQRPLSLAEEHQRAAEQIERQREKIRGRIAIGLVLALLVIVGLSFWYIIQVVQ
jgi:multisubunit Na+/H+ antiporter MnhB subunit